MPQLLSLARRLTPNDHDWPRALDQLAAPPSELTLAGALPSLTAAVAIVGTRRPDALAVQFTRELAGELATAGCTIVSGGALGIDTAAHLGALDRGGATIAVLATGLARPYPAQNRELFLRVVERGALLSEARDRIPGFASAFLERNRIIAALARVVIVVQAGQRSGALSTAAHARKLGRPLLVVPHAPWQARGAGCLSLLVEGALLCRGLDDVVGQLGALQTRPLTPAAPPVSREPPADLSEDERVVWSALERGEHTAEDLCELTALPAARVQRSILLLLLSGRISETGPGRYLLKRAR